MFLEISPTTSTPFPIQLASSFIFGLLKLFFFDSMGIVWTWQNGRVGSGSSRVNRVASQNGTFLNGSIGLRVESGCKPGRVDLYFSNIFFFFEIDAIYQLFMSSLTVIRFLLVILLPITTKHLT